MLLLASILAGMQDLPSLPMVQGDFDHDGQVDVARLEHGGGDEYRLVIERTAPGALGRVFDVPYCIPSQDVPSFYLRTIRRFERRSTACGKGLAADQNECRYKAVHLIGDTLSFGTREASEAILLWNGARFEVVWLAD